MPLSGVFFAALLTILELTSCGGAVGGGFGCCMVGAHSTPPQPTLGTIASAVAAAVNKPYITGNSVQYYCDCTGPGQTCAAAGSTQGNDSTGTGAQASPYQTLDKGMTWLTGGVNRTLALCQGGSFTSAHTGQFVYSLAPTACAAGSICNEVREYPVTGVGAKPIINNPVGYRYLFSTADNASGYRFMNLKLQGTWDTTSGTKSNLGFFIYDDAGYITHDIDIENVDMDSFDLAIQDATNANHDITVTGNHFTNNAIFAYLGGSSNLTLSYNSFINNGSDNQFDHALYLA